MKPVFLAILLIVSTSVAQATPLLIEQMRGPCAASVSYLNGESDERIGLANYCIALFEMYDTDWCADLYLPGTIRDFLTAYESPVWNRAEFADKVTEFRADYEPCPEPKA